MKPVTTISGRAAPLDRANVDTDQIIPKQFLSRIERTGFGAFLFYDWARDEEGEPDPSFVLNRPAYRDSVVLVAGPNFGSGSSREHAPWSLQEWGFEAIIAPSFADIFHANCLNIGLLPVVLTQGEISRLMTIAHQPDNVVTVDLRTQSVTSDGFHATFDIDPFAKDTLLAGLDRIGVTLEHDVDIGRYEVTTPSLAPPIT